MEKDQADHTGELVDHVAADAVADHDGTHDELLDELLIEEISIDGMCGVY